MSTHAQALAKKLNLQRVDLNTGDLATGGLLPPESLKQFLSRMYNATPLLAGATQLTMNADTMHLPNIGFNGRIMMKDTGGQNAVVPADHRTKPVSGKRSLLAKKLRGEIDISYDYLEDNIEKEGFQEDLLMNHVAPQIGVDLSDNCLNGDTNIVVSNNQTEALSINDGWLVKATTNVLDAAGGNIDDALFNKWYRKVPARYLDRNAGPFQFFPQRDIALDWQKQVASRMTIEGDKRLIDSGIPPYSGRPVIGDVNIAVAGDGKTSGLFCDPKNLVVGVHRKVTIRPVDWPETESVRIFCSYRFDCDFYLEDAVAKLINVVAL